MTTRGLLRQLSLRDPAADRRFYELRVAIGSLLHVGAQLVRQARSSSSLPPPLDLPPRRVVVTGIGMQTPLGEGMLTSWSRLLEGHSGIQALDAARVALPGMELESAAKCFEQLPSKVAGLVPSSSVGDRDEAASSQPSVQHSTGDPGLEGRSPVALEPSERGLPRYIQLALLAAEEALRDASWKPEDPLDRQNTGVAIGGGIGPVSEIAAAGELIMSHRLRRLTPHFVPRVLINMPAGHVSIKYGFQGPNHSAATACATGGHSIGDAYCMIKRGDADVMLAGGTESCIDALSIGGFSRLRALSTKYNGDPARASRPFDQKRDGFVIAEGAGILVLEDLEHAIKRGAPRIYAEVRGYGLSGDAHHITQPSNEGTGACLAMERAIRSAGLMPQHIGYVNAHATSTPIGDEIEARAILRVFGKDHASNNDLFAMSSTKGATGHLLGAAGAVEAGFSALALFHGKVPPNINIDALDPVFRGGFQPTTGTCEMSNLKVVLTNSFGFGGTNTSIVLAEPPSL